MTGAFTIVVIAVAAIGVLGALAALLSGRRTWEAYGRDHLMLDSDPRAPARERSGVGAGAERDVEIRQLLEARNRRRRRRGEPELDVATELARLTASRPAPGAASAPAPAEGVDAALRAEIRELVIARNHRRVRRGRPPLDVEAELAREIARLTR